MYLVILCVNGLLIAMGTALPVLFGRSARNLLVGLALSLITVGALTAVFEWWRHVSVWLELWAMGADLSGVNAQERNAGVDPDLRRYAENLYWSPRNMGIRWQLKAIFGLALTLPFACLAFAGARVLHRRSVRRRG